MFVLESWRLLGVCWWVESSKAGNIEGVNGKLQYTGGWVRADEVCVGR